jgi:WD40 repeat protein
MALKTGDRYATALELAAEVERWLADEPVQAYPEPWTTKAGRWVKRHSPLVAGAAALVAAAVPLSVVIAVNSNAARRRAEDDARLIREQKEIVVVAKGTADQARDEAEKRRDQLAAVNNTLRRANYVADMNLAQHAWEANNLVRTRQLLERHRPKPGEDDLRGFEWHYLNRLFHRDRLTIQAHTGPAWSVVFTPDGKRLFTYGKARPVRGAERTREVPGEIKLWDATTGQGVDLALDGSTDAVGRIALSADGAYLGAICRLDGIKVWNLATHQRFDLKTPAEQCARSIGFSPDGKRLVATFSPLDDSHNNQDVVKVYDLATRDPVWTLEGLSYVFWLGIGAAAFSPDGKYLAMSHMLEGRVRVVEVATGREAFSCKYGDGKLYQAVFSPDGRSLAVSGDLGVSIWDVAAHQQRLTCQNSAPTEYCLAYSPDSKQLAISIAGGLGLWDAATGQQISTFKGHAGRVLAISFRSDGRYLASAGYDGTVRVWDTTARGDAVSLFKGLQRLGEVDFSPGGQALFVTDMGATDSEKAYMVDPTTGQRRGEPIHFDSKIYHCFDWTADGKQLIGPGDAKTIRIYDTAAGTLVHSFPVDREDVCVTAISPDGRWFAHSAPAATIKIRDAETGAERRAIRGLADQIQNLVIHSDGSRLAGADKKGWVKLWDVSTGRECISVQIQDMSVLLLRFSPDGERLAIVGGNSRLETGEARILDAATGREMLQLAGHTSTVMDVAFSPDGQRVATASWDRTIRIWDARTGQEILTLRGHALQINSVRFVSGGHQLISGSVDQTIRLWDATPLPE